MYLTEDNLALVLKQIKPNLIFIRNRKVPSSKLVNFRPDYRCEELKLIIEFDGYYHYSNPKQIYNDSLKDIEYKKLGYRIVRIPYFIQMCSELLNMIFFENLEYTQIYKHGFIDSKAMLPSAFCELGIKKFVTQFEQFKFAKKQIKKSLRNHIFDVPHYKLVIPDSLLKLFKTLEDDLNFYYPEDLDDVFEIFK